MAVDTRVRFSPSPTGYLHVGGAQSALFNWLVARGAQGEFLLRIEDTDAERNRPELTDNILDMLRWLGLDWDGQPVHQSERFHLYREAADKLLASGSAYACECTAEQVQGRNRERGGKPGYDGYCRDRGLEPGPGRALRFRTPREGVTAWVDVVRGRVVFENANIEDFVLLRSTGISTFLLANAVDDADMAITHVIRGEDHVNGTPKHLLLREALGLGPPPAFAHLPLLVNEGRKKLSKRRDDVSVATYAERGFLPEAMRNYLATLGWGPPDGVEIRPIAEIIDLFRLEDVNPSPAFFDLKKLEHFNATYIRLLDRDEFLDRAQPFLRGGPAASAALATLATEVQERVRRLDEVDHMIDFLYLDEPVIDGPSWQKVIERGTAVPELLDAALAAMAECEWTVEGIRGAIEAAAVTAGLVNAEGRPQLKKAQAPVRVAVTGRTVGPPLFESLAYLGRDRALERVRRARSRV